MSKTTRDRLLAAAQSVFQKHGFAESTVQMIAAEADANIAAVSYHFGSKADLYAEWVVHHLEDSMSRMPSLADNPTRPKVQLIAFIEWFFSRFNQDSPLRRLNEDMVNLKPTFLESILETVIRPEFENCGELVTAILPANATPDTIRNWVKNIMSLCAGPIHGGQLYPRIFPAVPFNDTEIEKQRAHVIQITLDGLAAETRRLNKESVPAPSR